MNIYNFFKKAFFINFGIFLVAFGIQFFRVPNNYVFGGVSGISQTLSFYTTYFSLSDIMFILNTILIILGFFFLERKNLLGIIYGSYALSFMLKFLENIAPITKPLTEDSFIEITFAVFIPAIGSAILYKEQLNTGGTEIIAKIITKYTGLRIHIVLMALDFIIIALAGYTFGIKIFLYSTLGLVLRTYMVDLVLDSLYLTKVFNIITDYPDMISDYINTDLKHGSTIINAYGGYTAEEKYIVTTTLYRREAAKLQAYLDKYHPTAFTTITNSSKVIGRGFARSQ